MQKSALKNRFFSFTLCLLLAPTYASASTMADIGTLGGNDSEIIDASSNGSILVGRAKNGAGFYHAYYYSGGVLTDLGTLGGNSSQVNAISANGSIMVGSADTIAGLPHAFIYSSGVMTDIGTLPAGIYSFASSISADGSVVVGSSDTNIGVPHAFKYAGGVMTDLGTLGGNFSSAVDVSANGSVIVGNAETGLGFLHGFQYSGGVMSDLGTLGGDFSFATGVSANGNIIIGYADTPTQSHAFKYSGGVMTDLGTLAPSGDSHATAISADGSVIVGYSDTITSSHAFKYAGNTMTDLGTLGGSTSAAIGVSADGSIIVGDSDTAGGFAHAFKYFGNTMTDLGTLGGNTSHASGISADGTVIYGNADTASGESHAFIYHNAIVDLNNTYSTISGSLSQLSSVMNLQTQLLDAGLNYDCNGFGANGQCIAISAALASDNDSHASQTGSVLRLGYRLPANIHVGAFLDQSLSNSLPGDYHLKNDMPLIGAFAGWSAKSNGLGPAIRISAAYSHRDLDITRDQLAFTEAGSGSSSITVKGAQIEGSWAIALNKKWIAQPFAGLRTTEITRSAYTENGFNFPVSFDTNTQHTIAAFAGQKISGKLTEELTGHLTAGVQQDIKSNISDSSGSLYSVGGFNMGSPNMLHTRGFASTSLDYQIDTLASVNTTLAASQNTTNHGIGATVSVGYSAGF